MPPSRAAPPSSIWAINQDVATKPCHVFRGQRGNQSCITTTKWIYQRKTRQKKVTRVSAGFCRDAKLSIIKLNRKWYLVKVAKAHPLYGRCLPLRQRGNKLHSRGLLLQHAEGQGAQDSITLIYEGLGRRASVDSYHLTAWKINGWHWLIYIGHMSINKEIHNAVLSTYQMLCIWPAALLCLVWCPNPQPGPQEHKSNHSLLSDDYQ